MLPSPTSPILFSIGTFSLRYYSLCILAGVLIGQWFALKRAKKINIAEDHILNMVFSSLISGLIGARIFHVLYEYKYYFEHINEIPKVWEGGLAIHGGILFGSIAIYLYCKKQSLQFLDIADLFVPSLLIGQIIGRFGNYFNQEAFGTPTTLPWGIYISPEHRPVNYLSYESFHPTFLYEGLWNTLLLYTILWYEKKYKKATGSILGIYLIGYGIGRFFIEMIRTDATYLGPLKFVHWISLICILSGGILFLRKNHKC